MKRRRLLQIAVALALAAAPARAGEPEARYLQWYSEGPTPSDIARDTAALYERLHDHGLLRLRAYEDQDPKGLPVAEILRRERLWWSRVFPESLDVLLCRLNRSVCSIERRTEADGRVVSQARWRNGSGSKILIPANVAFVPYESPQPYDKARGEDAAQAAASKRGGCEAADESCRERIAKLNSRNPKALDPAYQGSLLLPTFALRAQVDLLGTEPPPAPSSDAPTATDPAPAAARESDPPAAEMEALREIRVDREIEQRIVPTIEKHYESHEELPDGACSLGPHRASLFSSIRHPGAVAVLLPVRVAVFDTKVDARHCAFADSIVEVHHDIPREEDADEPAPAPDCETCNVDDQGTSFDHGTHVAVLVGIAAGELRSGGQSPIARIHTFEMKPDLLAMASEIYAAAWDQGVDVYNFSDRYFPTASVAGVGGGDPVADRIKQLEGNKLFVAAGGNEERDLDLACDVMPACIESKNVVAVAALDAADPPRLLGEGQAGSEGSNRGLQLDVVAPGADVFSALAHNKWGKLSGTSQAAPIVTAAASLLLSTDGNMRPSAVKRRLIYTADLLPTLRGKVLGGRINLERALAWRSDLLELQEDGAPRRYQGEIDYAELYYRPFGAARSEQIQMSQVLRLHRAEGGSTHTLFVLEPSHPGGEPRRFDDVELLPTSSRPARLRTLSGELVEFQPTQVVDYVARLHVE